MQFSKIDIGILSWIQDHQVPHSIPFLSFISDATTYVSIIMALIVLIPAAVQKSGPLLLRFYTLVAVLLLVALVSWGLKELIDRDRPFITYPAIEKLSAGGDSSFPSGHSLEAFAMAAALSVMFKRRRIIIPVYAWALLVAYSRMALGVHYPSDVLAGIVIGSLIGWGIPRLFSRFFR